MAAALQGLFGTPEAWHAWRRSCLHAVAGTSIGAVQAVGYAAGLTPWDMAEELAALPWATLVTPTAATLYGTGDGQCSLAAADKVSAYITHTLTRHGIDPHQGIGAFCEQYGVDVHIAVNVLREGCVMTTEVWGPRGVGRDISVGLALQATTAIPGVFPAVSDPSGRLVVDGGVMCNVPAHTFPKARTLIVRTVGGSSPPVLPPPLRAGGSRMTGPAHAWARLSLTVINGMRAAAEETQLHGAPWVLHTWARSSGLGLLDLHASPEKLACAVEDGLHCGRRVLLQWQLALLLLVAQTVTQSPPTPPPRRGHTETSRHQDRGVCREVHVGVNTYTRVSVDARAYSSK